MNKKINLILNYLIIFVTSIMLLLLVCLALIKTTILKPNYIIKSMDKINYYQKLHDNIKKEMSYYTNQSGFEDDILDNTFTLDEVKKDVTKYIKNIYLGKNTNIDTSKFEERLNKKIDDFIEEENFTITNRKELEDFVKEMAKIYKSKITITTYLAKVSSLINKLNKIINIVLITDLVLLILLFYINKKVLKQDNNPLVLLINSFLLIAIYLYIHGNISIKYLFIYNELLSTLLVFTITNILNYCIYIAIIFIILAISIYIFRRDE